MAALDKLGERGPLHDDIRVHQHLRGRPQALLDQPSARYHEVTSYSQQAETRA